jgi:SAM-dependent methyltransferase
VFVKSLQTTLRGEESMKALEFHNFRRTVHRRPAEAIEPQPSSLEHWERVETERSALEASIAGSAALLAHPNLVSRYAAPPADTVHPLEYAFHLLGDVRGKTILEYGCGDGVNTLCLANRGARIVALDLSPELLAIAKRRAKLNGVRDVEFVAGSAHNVPLPDSSVDVVFGIAILHHLDLGLASKEVTRLVRKGGVAIFQEPVRNSKLLRAARNLIPYKSPDVSRFERPLTDKELKEFARGFSSYHSRPFHTLPVALTVALSCYLSPSLRKYMLEPSLRVDSEVLRMFPALGYFSPVKVVKIVK